MQKERWIHILYYKDKKAVCTKCGGTCRTVRSDEIILHCIDCDTFFRAIGFGKAEAELKCEEVEVG